MLGVIISVFTILLIAFAACHAQPMPDDREQEAYIDEWKKHHWC